MQRNSACVLMENGTICYIVTIREEFLSEAKEISTFYQDIVGSSTTSDINLSKIWHNINMTWSWEIWLLGSTSEIFDSLSFIQIYFTPMLHF